MQSVMEASVAIIPVEKGVPDLDLTGMILRTRKDLVAVSVVNSGVGHVSFGFLTKVNA